MGGEEGEFVVIATCPQRVNVTLLLSLMMTWHTSKDRVLMDSFPEVVPVSWCIGILTYMCT